MGFYPRAGIVRDGAIVKKNDAVSIYLAACTDADGIHGSHFPDDLLGCQQQVGGAGHRRGDFVKVAQMTVFPDGRLYGCAADVQCSNAHISLRCR